MKATAVILVELDLDDLAAGDPQTEAARDVVRAIGEAVRHRLVAAGVSVGAVHSALASLDPAPPAESTP